MPEPAEGKEPANVVAQIWDDQKQILTRTVIRAPAAEIDVRYDALLANRRPLDDPEVLHVEPGESVLLRLIAASSATNFYIDTGQLEAEVLAVDGQEVRPIRGNFFQLGTAQRMDLRLSIPKQGGAFPILAQGEGSKLLCGAILLTKGALPPKLSTIASLSTAALSNVQESRLRAANPLPEAKLDRMLDAALSGDMAAYVWNINGEAYPNRNSLDVRSNDRVGIVLTNSTTMGHPMRSRSSNTTALMPGSGNQKSRRPSYSPATLPRPGKLRSRKHPDRGCQTPPGCCPRWRRPGEL
jgi:FtsP/CotA-like multicopper oxidase with cupredoxin domain